MFESVISQLVWNILRYFSFRFSYMTDNLSIFLSTLNIIENLRLPLKKFKISSAEFDE